MYYHLLQLGVGALLAEKQRDRIVSEIEDYIRGSYFFQLTLPKS